MKDLTLEGKLLFSVVQLTDSIPEKWKFITKNTMKLQLISHQPKYILY